MKTRNYIIATVIFIVITVVFSIFPHTKFNKKMYFNTFQGVFNKKIELANFYVKKLENADFKEALEVNSYIRDRGLHFLIYDKDSLSFWSTNSFELPSYLNEIDTAKKLIWISNLHFYQIVKQFDNRTIIALINLQTRFPFRNDYMINGIRPEFGLPEGSTICEISDEEMSIVDVEGNKLFALDMQSGSTNYLNLLITTILFFITIVLILVSLYYVSKNYIRKTNRYVFLFILSLVLLLLRVIFIRQGIIPARLLSFDPFIYASFIAPTLGDLLINSLVFFWFGYTLFRLVKLPDSFFRSKTHSSISLILLFIGLIGTFQFVFNVSLSLVEHSTLNLVVNRIDDITLDLAIGYFVLLLNHMGFAFCMLWMMQMLKSRIDLKQQSLVLFIVIGLVLAIIFVIGIKTNILAFVFLYLVYIVSAIIQNKTNRSFFISYLLLAVILLSVYIEVFTIYYSSIKEENYKITYAEDLASEQDAYVKYLVVALTDSILKDEFINQAVFDTSIEAKLVHDHLKDKYFGGYWKKYELHTMNICKPYDFLAGSRLNCYEFYDTLVNDLGYKIPGADFYFLNNYNGNISYLGTITFVNERGKEAKLYLELDSQSSHDLLDYPKLLLDQEIITGSVLDKYDYAKYHKGKLITTEGTYNYSLSSREFEQEQFTKISKSEARDYIHLIYRPDKDNMIVVSKEKFGLLNIAIIFSYLFIFNFILIFLFLLLARLEIVQYSSITDFRTKVQIAIISILLFSMLVVGSSTIGILIRNHKLNQVALLKEKIQSVFIEIEHKLYNEETLENGWSSSKYKDLNALLIKFRDVFYNDIHLYSPDGELLATSRTEIFNQGLQGRKMNSKAFYNLTVEQKRQYIHQERIYKIEYMSAYLPFRNINGKLLAYMNLPSSTKQTDLQEGITRLSVTIINIYIVFILLTLFLAYLISNQLTRPLELLRIKLSEFKLGEKHERIEYQGSDEIARLVEEYNRTLDELEKSANLLAKSEREMAWREMAKQVAHEIKNPLTPMRLSVQQLQRAWSDKDDHFEEYLCRMSQTLIEQIDTLSTIATEFSNFAKIPTAQISEIDLADTLNKVVKLFESDSSYEIKYNHIKEKLLIHADGEQLKRVFINIVKNAIQAIPPARKGEIKVDLKQNTNTYVVCVSDNGKGIPEGIHDKLFQPNFTTKSSGMGLGLAIVKKILDQFDAQIRFETKPDIGTTFYIELKKG